MGFLLLVISQQVLQRLLSTVIAVLIDVRLSNAQLCRFVSLRLNASIGFVSPQWVQVFVLLDICSTFYMQVEHM
jgi:hypothetical protein